MGNGDGSDHRVVGARHRLAASATKRRGHPTEYSGRRHVEWKRIEIRLRLLHVRLLRLRGGDEGAERQLGQRDGAGVTVKGQ
jgi:hypothetical protein